MDDDLEHHVRGFFAGHTCVTKEWPVPAAAPRLPRLAVIEVSPGPRLDLWTYVSVGAWRCGRGVHASEFLLHSPEPSERHVELLSIVAISLHVSSNIETSPPRLLSSGRAGR